MENAEYIISTIIGVLMIVGVIAGFFFILARWLGESYDKKPLKYIELKINKNMDKIKCQDCDEVYDPAFPHFCSNSNKGTEKERLEKRTQRLESQTENNKNIEGKYFSQLGGWPQLLGWIIKITLFIIIFKLFGVWVGTIIVAITFGLFYFFVDKRYWFNSPNNKKIFLAIMGAIVFILILITSYFLIFKPGETASCKQKCEYNPASQSWRADYTGKRFQTQEQCVDYCKSIK